MTANESRVGELSLRDVRRRFDRAAARFDHGDFVHRRAASGLFERMTPMLLEASRVLDAGAGRGAASRGLAQRFPRGRIVSLDISSQMLRHAKRARSRFGRVREVQADAHRLPFADGSFDVVFANMLLPWIDDAPAFFGGVARVLREDGLFVFSGLGPDSLRELREAWLAADAGHAEHVNRFADMHDVGDALVRAGLKEPVLDVDHLTVSYRGAGALFADLTAAGARNCLEGRGRSLTGRRRFAGVRRHLEQRFAGGPLALELELVFGHAWGGGPPAPPGEFRLAPAAIGRRRA